MHTSYTFSPIQGCANLYKNKSTPPDSLCAVCTFCMCMCVLCSGITPPYCECVLLSSRGTGFTKCTFSSSEGYKCVENERNSSTRVQCRPSQRHLYYSQTGGPYNTTHLEIYSTNQYGQAAQEMWCKHANTLWMGSFRRDLTWYSGSKAFKHNFMKHFRL